MLLDGDLFIEQGAEVVTVFVEGGLVTWYPRQQLTGVARRLFLRPTEQIALHQIDTHLRQHRQLFGQLDAFGDHLGARGFGHFQDGADELAFDRILVNAVDEMTIDLHVVRAQFRPQTQAGVAGTQIIQGDGKAHGTIVVQRVVEQGEVFGGRLFGELDHHLAGRDAEGLQQLQGAPGLVAGVEQRLRRDVEKQLAFQAQITEASAGALAAGHFQLAEAAGMTRHGEQRQRRVQRAVGRAASQCLVAENALFGQRDDRLEQAAEVAVSEDVAQCAQLLGDGHGGLDLAETKGPVFNRPLHFTTVR